MQEAPIPVAPPLPGGANPAAGKGRAPEPALHEARALTILTTEHWSLLSARSLVYNEAFARAGMFLAFLSATLVALGLIATATGFSDGFLTVAGVVLALNLFVGLGSLARIAGASAEDIRYLQGMNRLRHAYHDMVPGLERYFITSKYDDVESVLSFYGPVVSSPARNLLHGMTTTPAMLAVISSAVAGALSAVVTILTTHIATTAAVAGIGGFAILFVILNGVLIFQIRTSMLAIVAIFPRTDWDDD